MELSVIKQIVVEEAQAQDGVKNVEVIRNYHDGLD